MLRIGTELYTANCVYTLEATEAEFNLSLLHVRDNKHVLVPCFQDEGRSMGASNYCHHAPPSSCQQSKPSPTLCNTLCRAETIQTQLLRRRIHYYFEPSATFWFSKYFLTSCFSAILYLRNVNLHTRMDTTVNKVTSYEPNEKGAIPRPTDTLFLPQCVQWISVQRSPSNLYHDQFPLGVKQPKREAVNLLPLAPRLRMLGSFYFTSPFAPTARCSFKRGWLPFEAKPCISNTVSA